MSLRFYGMLKKPMSMKEINFRQNLEVISRQVSCTSVCLCRKLLESSGGRIRNDQ
jgi:hypothetical protein